MAGSSNETEISAQITTDIGLTTNRDLILAKQGMRVDEWIMIVYNEIKRARALFGVKLVF